MPGGLLGSETPRIFTPPLRELTPETSLGFDCIEFAEAIGVELFPWERWCLIHILELLEDGSLRFRAVILLVARQNGKTTLLKILALFWMVVLGRLLVIGTAQNLDIAEETWEDTVLLAQSSPEIAALIPADGITRQVSKKSLQLVTGERYKVAASTRRGGRGLSGDLVELDELREHHSWASWAAVSSTTMAITDAMVLAASNAGDLLSVVLRQLRLMCMSDPDTVGVDPRELAAFGHGAAVSEDQPEDLDELLAGTVGVFEYSAHPDRGLWDREGWAEANPSLGWTITEAAMATQAKIASASLDAEWTFRTENLCQWRPMGSGGPFPDGAWDAGVDKRSDVAEESSLAVCVDTSHDGGWTSIAVAGYRSDGHVHAQVIERRAGTEWVLPWLTSPDRETRPRWGAVTWQLNGAPVSQLTDALKAPAVGLPVMEWAGPDLSRAHAGLFQLVRLPVKPKDPRDPTAAELADQDKKRLFHRPAPALDVPASTAATKPLGDGWVLDRRKSPADCAPLVAVVGAVWALGRIKPVFRSVYEDHGLMVV